MPYLSEHQIFDAQIQKRVRVSPLGAAIMTDPVRLIGPSFNTTLDTNFWTAANSGAGSAAGVASGIATLTSGTANSGYGKIRTNKLARFMFAAPNFLRVLARPTVLAVADCTRYLGVFTDTAQVPQDGFYFKITAAGALEICSASGGAETAVTSGNFNGAEATYSLSTDAKGYEIVYYMAGVWFFIDGVLVHKLTPTTAVLTAVFSLPINAIAVNGAGGTTSGTLEVWSMMVQRYGAEHAQPIYKYLDANATTVLKYGPGSLQRIVVGVAGQGGNTITLYDNTAASGTVIAVMGGGTEAAFDFDCDFDTGLTCVINGGTASKITVLYD